MTREIVIQNRLEVIGPDTVIIPGCEPISALTSPTLSRNSPCHGATVKLADALAAIPGSSVEFQINNGESNGSSRKWFVLPPVSQDCPCDSIIDVYAILRELAQPVEEEEQDFSACEVSDPGFCRVDEEIPATRPYQPEGSFAGISPMVWSPDIWGHGGSVVPGLELTSDTLPHVG